MWFLSLSYFVARTNRETLVEKFQRAQKGKQNLSCWEEEEGMEQKKKPNISFLHNEKKVGNISLVKSQMHILV